MLWGRKFRVKVSGATGGPESLGWLEGEFRVIVGLLQTNQMGQCPPENIFRRFSDQSAVKTTVFESRDFFRNLGSLVALLLLASIG